MRLNNHGAAGMQCLSNHRRLPHACCTDSMHALVSFERASEVMTSACLSKALPGVFALIGDQPRVRNSRTADLPMVPPVCAGALDGEVRLVGGRTDAGGAWQFGRLELRDRGFFVGLQDLQHTQVLGRRGVQVACQQLGFAAGAEVRRSGKSALPGPAGVVAGVSAVLCRGGEERLGDCDIFRDFVEPVCDAAEECAVALLCATPSGATLA